MAGLRTTPVVVNIKAAIFHDHRRSALVLVRVARHSRLHKACGASCFVFDTGLGLKPFVSFSMIILFLLSCS
jgi:hypothetical protein